LKLFVLFFWITKITNKSDNTFWNRFITTNNLDCLESQWNSYKVHSILFCQESKGWFWITNVGLEETIHLIKHIDISRLCFWFGYLERIQRTIRFHQLIKHWYDILIESSYLYKYCCHCNPVWIESDLLLIKIQNTISWGWN